MSDDIFNVNQNDDDSEDSKAKKILKQIQSNHQQELSNDLYSRPKTLRDILASLNPDEAYEKERELRRHPLWNEGFREGIRIGIRETKIEYQQTIRHLTELIQTQGEDQCDH